MKHTIASAVQSTKLVSRQSPEAIALAMSLAWMSKALPSYMPMKQPDPASRWHLSGIPSAWPGLFGSGAQWGHCKTGPVLQDLVSATKSSKNSFQCLPSSKRRCHQTAWHQIVWTPAQTLPQPNIPGSDPGPDTRAKGERGNLETTSSANLQVQNGVQQFPHCASQLWLCHTLQQNTVPLSGPSHPTHTR